MSIKKFNEFLQEKKLMKLSDEDREKENSKHKKEGDGYILTIITKEALEKAMKANKMTNTYKIGKHFKADNKEELEKLKEKYKKGDKYEGETISKIVVQNGDVKFEDYF